MLINCVMDNEPIFEFEFGQTVSTLDPKIIGFIAMPLVYNPENFSPCYNILTTRGKAICYMSSYLMTPFEGRVLLTEKNIQKTFAKKISKNEFSSNHHR